MTIIILDLEWNTAFISQEERFINEIIEFGAVKLNEQLQQIDTFQMFVRSQITTELTGKVKQLTHLTCEQLMEEGKLFPQVLEQFTQWAGQDMVLLTWSKTDLHVLLENCRYFTQYETIPFLYEYMDLQQYVQQRLDVSDHNQIALTSAAREVNIDLDQVELHRALDDSLLSAEVFRRCYDQRSFQECVQDVHDQQFYHRLCFKNFYVTRLDSEYINQKYLLFRCQQCGNHACRIGKWSYHDKAFHADFLCGKCHIPFSGKV